MLAADFPTVLALVAANDSSAMWRVFQPFAHLQSLGYPCEWEWVSNRDLGQIGPLFDVYVLPRLHWPSEKAERKFVDTVLKAGKVLIYETDDDLWVTAEWAYRVRPRTEQRQFLQMKHRLKSALSRCHGVTVTCDNLKAAVTTVTDKPVRVVPNLIDWNWFTSVASRAERPWPDLTIGWVGATRNAEDTEFLAPAWKHIADHHPEVRFIIAGHIPEALANAVPSDRLKTIAWVPDLRLYPAAYQGVDIGCAPLAPTLFNRSKSWIKALEYAAVGAAVVASPTVYEAVLTNGCGLVARTTEDWINHLTLLVENPGVRESMASRWRDEVLLNHTLRARAHLWVDAWQDIWLPNRRNILVA